jgi:hypothetical protein
VEGKKVLQNTWLGRGDNDAYCKYFVADEQITTAFEDGVIVYQGSSRPAGLTTG